MSIRRLLKSVARDLLPYAGLDFYTPSGLHLYVPDRGAWSSAGEVFFSRGYDPFYKHLDGVRDWVDLGCNQGFFSFGLLDHLARTEGHFPETRAFLGDANQHCVKRVIESIKSNDLQDRWKCEQVVIGPPDSTVKFEQHKDSIHSNIFAVGRSQKNLHLSTTNISRRFAGEQGFFDLIKIDIEGAEKFLFQHHLDFLKRFRYGICEWHTPAFTGTDLERFIRQLKWKVIEFQSSPIQFDPRKGHSWESYQGVAFWENPAPAK
jgi:FkbM family methyltransferase